MSDNFLRRLNLILHGRSNATSECTHDVDHYMFYRYSLIPAAFLTVLLAATSTRRHLLPNFLGGRPGLIFPMDTMTRSARFSYSCAFGATAFLVYLILIEQKFAFEYHGPVALKTLIAVVSMFVYGMVFFPVFASLALATAFSYFLGSFYVWMFLVTDVYKLTECSFNTTGRVVLIIHALPRLLCLTYLSVSLPVRFIISCKNRQLITPLLGEAPYGETLEIIKKSYQGKHVRTLLQKPVVKKEVNGFAAKLKLTIENISDNFLYHRQRGFRFPSRLLSVMFAAASVIYVVTVEFLAMFLHVYNQVKLFVDISIRASSFFMMTSVIERQFIAVMFINVIKWSMVVSVCMACLTSFINILLMMTSFRTNLYALYRGDNSQIPPPSAQNAPSLCVGSIKYAGFQVAYIFWAYVISIVLYLIISFILSAVILSVMQGYSDWMLHIISQIWPSVLSTVVIMVLQILLAKHIFLQGNGQHLRLDNRRFFFIFTYFMFFFNIFLGFFSCLLRILKAIMIGIMFLPRLDCSVLPRKFEFFDPGFTAYQGYIHLEVAHTHPVVNVFIRLLAALSKSRKLSVANGDVESDKAIVSKKHQGEASVMNVSARFHWFVTYTLLHNPTIRIYRKGFVQAMKKARMEGLKVPISDQPITEFDLVKLQQQKERAMEEAAASKCHKAHYGLVDGMTTLTLGVGGVRQKVVLKVQGRKKNRGRSRRFLLFRNHTKKSLDSSLIQSFSTEDRDSDVTSEQSDVADGEDGSLLEVKDAAQAHRDTEIVEPEVDSLK